MRMRLRILAVMALALVLGTASGVVAQERFGSLTGTASDAQGGAMPGVAVTITNQVTAETKTYVTDTDGRYLAPDLNPGRYTVTFEISGFNKIERKDILVILGRQFTLDAQLQVGAVTEVVSVTAETTPLVDNRSTLITHNVTEEEFDRLPKTRSFQSIAFTAPSVNQGEVEGGMQVNGASGAENAFTVDGIVTNSLINGQSRQNTVFEYLSEVQVKTSGISAEFGGALGGVVSAVTKSGGNAFRGEGHYYYEGNALYAAPVKRLFLEPQNERTADFVQDKEQTRRQQEFGGSVGGPIIRDRLFFYGSYSPRNEFSNNDYNFTDGPGAVERNTWRQQAFGKLTLNTKKMNLNWSTLWTPTTQTGILSAYDGVLPNQINRTRASLDPNKARGFEANQVNTSLLADITLDDSSFVSLKGGLFHDRYTDTGIPDTTPWTYGSSTATLNSILPANLQGPSGFANTPRAQITGFDTTKRWSFNADYNRVFNAGGFHTLKAGYMFQHVVNDINSYYPGGYVNIFWDRSFTFGGQTGRGTYGYYEVNDRRISNKAGADINALYIQDQWTVGSKLTLNLGIRTEDEKIPTFRPDYQETAFHFSFADKLAPRLGAAYDVHGDGRFKVFGSWGLYYDWTKYELPRGSFGAETWCIYYRGLDSLNINSFNLSNMPGRDLWFSNPGGCRDRRVPSFGDSIDPNIKPMKQSSVSGGMEYQIGRSSVVTARYVHNDLLETIEDIGYLNAEGDEGYIIGNPGRGVTAIQYPYSATPLGQPTPRPKRQYDALELGYNRRFSGNWFFSANYTLSRLYGNYAGLASSDEITTPTTGGSSSVAQQSGGSIARPGGNVNRAWDADELLWDSRGNLDVRGRLATDRPHVVKLYGSYDFPFGTQIGAFFYGGSGTPLSTYVTTTHSIDMFVYGRGDMGRTPVLTRTDLLLSHEVRMLGTKRARFELNVQNIFNQKTTRHIFNFLNKGGIIPDRSSSYIDTSDVDLRQGFNVDQKILATPDGANAYDPRYRKADLFEDGLRGFVTLKFLF